MTLDERTDSLSNSDRDYQQDKNERALKAFGRPLWQLAPLTRYKISHWVNEDAERSKQMGRDKEMPIRDTLAAYHERVYHEDETTVIRRIDLKRAFDQLREKYGEAICEAAAGIISKREASKLLRMRESVVRRLTDEANVEAVTLLKEYRRVLPAALKSKYS